MSTTAPTPTTSPLRILIVDADRRVRDSLTDLIRCETRLEAVAAVGKAEAAFEAVWRTRESYLSNMAGFVEFHLLKGPVAEDHTLYSSHTVWADKAAFEAWTKSEEFRRAHARADNKTGESLYLGHPKFEGFDVILSERKSSAAA